RAKAEERQGWRWVALAPLFPAGVHRPDTLPQLDARGDGVLDELLARDARVGRVHPASELGRDGGREDAARSVGVATGDARGLEPLVTARRAQQVWRLVSAEMTALDERDPDARGEQRLSGLDHLVAALDPRGADQPGRLGQVGRDDRGPREQVVAEGTDGVVGEKRVA